MQLVRKPKQFDLSVTDNLFANILSDAAAMLTGSLGMLPSASLAAADATGRRAALYEPVHGTAPDLPGQEQDNPPATLLTFPTMPRSPFPPAADPALPRQAVTLRTGGGVGKCGTVRVILRG